MSCSDHLSIHFTKQDVELKMDFSRRGGRKRALNDVFVDFTPLFLKKR